MTGICCSLLGCPVQDIHVMELVQQRPTTQLCPGMQEAQREAEVFEFIHSHGEKTKGEILFLSTIT